MIGKYAIDMMQYSEYVAYSNTEFYVISMTYAFEELSSENC